MPLYLDQSTRQVEQAVHHFKVGGELFVFLKLVLIAYGIWSHDLGWVTGVPVSKVSHGDC